MRWIGLFARAEVVADRPADEAGLAVAADPAVVLELLVAGPDRQPGQAGCEPEGVEENSGEFQGQDPLGTSGCATCG